MTQAVTPYLIALGIGLLVGLERERHKGSGPGRGPAGIRTFALVAVLGTLAMAVGGAGLVAAVIIVIAVLVGAAYLQRRGDDPGLTTEVALLAMPLLGAMTLTQPLLASTIGVITTGMLAAKPMLHRFVRGTLTPDEVNDGLVFAIATIVIWPQLPDRAMGPLGALNPHNIWLVVILILAIGAAGHVAVRALGPRFGLALSGLAAGFVSSVATIGAMAGKAKADPAERTAAVAGAILSSVATFVQMVIVLAAISLKTLVALAPMLAAGGAVISIFGGYHALRAARSPASAAAAPGRAFSVGAALFMAAALAAVTLATAAAQPWFGTAGITLSAAIGGILDTHAAAMAVATLVAANKLTAGTAVIPILAAMTANATMKIAMAISVGRPDFVVRVAGAIILSIAAAWATALLLA